MSEPYRSDVPAYSPTNRTSALLIIASLVALFGILVTLLAFASGNWVLGLVLVVVTAAGMVSSVKLQGAENRRLLTWLQETYGEHFTAAELQRLEQGRAVDHPGGTWLKIDRREEPWLVGFALRRLQAERT